MAARNRLLINIKERCQKISQYVIVARLVVVIVVLVIVVVADVAVLVVAAAVVFRCQPPGEWKEVNWEAGGTNIKLL